MGDEREWWEDGTATVGGETRRIVAEPYWDGDDFVVPLEGGVVRCVNAYPSSVRFDFGDGAPDPESVTLVGNNRAWASPAGGGGPQDRP